MPAHVIVGAQWGDEGKGKVAELYTEFADAVVRYQGGHSSGHTLMVDGHERITLHLIPSGVLHARKRCLIASGVALDVAACLAEIDSLRERGYLSDPTQLLIAEDASVIMPYHIELELGREATRGATSPGAAGRGIGPCHEDRVARRAILVRDLLQEPGLRAKLEPLLGEKNAVLAYYGRPPFELDALVQQMCAYGAHLKPYVRDTRAFIREELARDRQILFEGTLGTLLDVGLGTYPFVASSHTSAAGVCVSTGVAPNKLDQIVGIAKAYSTRVGEGPFLTECTDELGAHLQRVGREVDVITGRPRRCGWLDAAGLRYAARVNGMTALAISKLDVLTGLGSIKLAVGYQNGQGQQWDEPPLDTDVLRTLAPVYESWPGWREDISGVRQWEDLPAQARRFLTRLETILEIPIVLVSVGPSRAETIVRRHIHR